MKWVMKEPSFGDMIRVELGGIYHVGIYVSDDEVIQFGLAPSQRVTLRDSEVEVLSSDIDRFLVGGFLEVCEFDKKEKKKNRKPADVVKFARSRLGMRGYNIIYNNCEHFATECVTGVRSCRQAEDVREMFRNMPIVDVYIAELPECEATQKLSFMPRQEEIDKISNERVRREKYYVWKLLEYGLQRSLGLSVDDIAPKKQEGGRYIASKVDFSLSHSDNALAVAISRAAVGVDIESFASACRDRVAERVMNDSEYKKHSELSEEERKKNFLEVWTAKEALFKASHSERFEPEKTDTERGGYKSFLRTVGDREYCLSVATNTPERIRIFENIKL